MRAHPRPADAAGTPPSAPAAPRAATTTRSRTYSLDGPWILAPASPDLDMRAMADPPYLKEYSKLRTIRPSRSPREAPGAGTRAQACAQTWPRIATSSSALAAWVVARRAGLWSLPQRAAPARVAGSRCEFLTGCQQVGTNGMGAHAGLALNRAESARNRLCEHASACGQRSVSRGARLALPWRVFMPTPRRMRASRARAPAPDGAHEGKARSTWTGLSGGRGAA